MGMFGHGLVTVLVTLFIEGIRGACSKYSPGSVSKVAMEPNLMGPPLLGGSGRAWAFKFRFFSTACIWTCTGIPLIAASVGFQDWPTGETQAFYCG